MVLTPWMNMAHYAMRERFEQRIGPHFPDTDQSVMVSLARLTRAAGGRVVAPGATALPRLGAMRWLPDPFRPGELVLRCHGVRVGRVEPDGHRYLARVRFPGVHVLGVFARLRDAQRFVERELWSEAGELAPLDARAAATAAAGTFWLLRDLARASGRARSPPASQALGRIDGSALPRRRTAPPQPETSP
jgi:hypothetical protein